MPNPFTSKSETATSEGGEFGALLISDDPEPGYAVFCPLFPG